MLCSAFILKFIIAVAALAVAGIIIITRTFEVKRFKNLREANRHNFCSHQNVTKSSHEQCVVRYSRFAGLIKKMTCPFTVQLRCQRLKMICKCVGPIFK